MRHLHFDKIDSTNSEARRLALAGERSAILLTATTQSAGRGRDGRTWQSPKGGAWMSVLWPIKVSIEQLQQFPLIVGLATWHAIHETSNRFSSLEANRLQIKWPNDILLDDKKVAGILCETVATGSSVTHLIAGVGINVSFHISKLQGPLRHPPTSLQDVLGATSKWIEPLTEAFGRQMEEQLERFDRDGFDRDFYHDIASRIAGVGEQKTWKFGDEKQSGMLVGIDDAGRLKLDIGGSIIAVDYGELVTNDVTGA